MDYEPISTKLKASLERDSPFPTYPTKMIFMRGYRICSTRRENPNVANKTLQGTWASCVAELIVAGGTIRDEGRALDEIEPGVETLLSIQAPEGAITEESEEILDWRRNIAIVAPENISWQMRHGEVFSSRCSRQPTGREAGLQLLGE